MDRRSRGVAAEKVVAAYERLRLGPERDFELKYVGDRHGLGFDFQSLNSVNDASPRFIEVKAFPSTGYIFLTERERVNLQALGDSAWIYLVDVDQKRVVQKIKNPIRFVEKDPTALIYKIKI